MTSTPNRAPGYYADPIRTLSDEQIRAVADYIVSREPIWSRLREVRAEEWIGLDLVREINGQYTAYAREDDLCIFGLDGIAAIDELRRRAPAEQIAMGNQVSPGRRLSQAQLVGMYHA